MTQDGDAAPNPLAGLEDLIAVLISINPVELATKVITEGEDPSWAPNSRTLVFARRTSKFGPRKLSLLDWPTGHVKDIAQVAGSSSQPSWSR